MKIDDFSNEEFIECIKLYSPSYKNKYNGESMLPVEIKELQRTNYSVSIITNQLFMDKYLIENIYKFTNSENNEIKTEVIEINKNDNPIYDVSDKFIPLLKMVTENNLIKGDDWLSRLSYDDFLYFANKYHCQCSSIMIEVHKESTEHCKSISLKDENDYYIDTIVFGDYGIGYNHYGKLSKLNQSCVFDKESLEFFYLITSKLNHEDIVEYAKKFVATNKIAFETSHSNKYFYNKEIEKATLIEKKLWKKLNIISLNKIKRK